jgi:hypothetical protein
VTFYGDCTKICEDFAPKFGDIDLAAASSQRTFSHFLLHLGLCTRKNNRTVVSFPPYISVFPRLKIKLKGRHFVSNEVIEAESQAVLNTLTEHDFQGAFEERRKRWERCIRVEADCFEVDGGQQAPS